MVDHSASNQRISQYISTLKVAKVESVNRDIWYATVGSDPACIRSAIIMAKATGSIGATQEEQDGKGNVLKTATVRREGYQTADYYKL